MLHFFNFLLLAVTVGLYKNITLGLVPIGTSMWHLLDAIKVTSKLQNQIWPWIFQFFFAFSPFFKHFDVYDKGFDDTTPSRETYDKQDALYDILDALYDLQDALYDLHDGYIQCYSRSHFWCLDMSSHKKQVYR